MIVVDSSALVAVVLGETDAESLLAVMQREPVAVSAATVVEATIIVEARQGHDAARDLNLLLEGVGADVVALDAEHAKVAIQAWRRFGKGRHPAGLNFGDCLAYAAARIADVSLLYKGNDFGHTDIASATE